MLKMLSIEEVFRDLGRNGAPPAKVLLGRARHLPHRPKVLSDTIHTKGLEARE